MSVKQLAEYRDSKGRKRVKWLRVCDVCGAEKWLTEHYKGFRAKIQLCIACSNRENGFKKRGKPGWNKGNKKPADECQLGSSYVNQFGEHLTYMGPNTLRKDGYELTHRLVVKARRGLLLPSEVVHHIDGDKLNNAYENLFVCKDNSHHRKIHKQLENVAFVLVKAGIITFDGNCYQVAPHISDNVTESREFRGSLRQQNSAMVILSQASKEEGATTIPTGSRAQVGSKRATPQVGDDIVCSSLKDEEV